MSYTYRCEMQETLRQSYKAENSVSYQVKMTTILSQREMDSLLELELEKQGWVREEKGVYSTTGEIGEEIVWDVQEGTVSAFLEREEVVEKEVKVVSGGFDQAQANSNARTELQKEKQKISEQATRSQKSQESEMAQKLKDSEGSRRGRVNSVIQKVYGNALRQKASSMGTVMSVRESDDDSGYDMVIRVAE